MADNHDTYSGFPLHPIGDIDEKVFVSLALIALPVLSIASKAENNTMTQSGSTPLVTSSIHYGMMANAYLNSPVGMVVEGYRYQLRSLYLAYLEKKINEPGHTVSTINDRLLSDWMIRTWVGKKYHLKHWWRSRQT